MKNIRIIIVLLPLIFLIPQQSTAQYWNPDKSSRFFVGGSIGLQFGSITNIEVAPMGGLNLLPRWNTGLSFVYNYINNTLFNNYKTSILGGRTFTEVVILNNIGKYIPINLIDNIYLHGEYEILRYEGDYYNLLSGNSSNQHFVESINAGAGFGVPMGGNNTLKVSFLYNVTENEYYPYANPMIRLDLSIYFNKSLPSRYKSGME
jgi:hypothetical protein